jgi:hypothetical protein
MSRRPPGWGFTAVVAVIVLMVFWATRPASAWFAEGHRRLTAASVVLAGDSLPPFLQVANEAMMDDSVLADLMRHSDLAQLREREAPDHYMNLEMLGDRALPKSRSELERRLSRERGPYGFARPLGAAQLGRLPYAVVEWTQRLTVILAQIRQRPKDSRLQSLAVHYAALMAHYAEDLCQPLHSTVHHDGRARADGSSPHTGFHQRVDALLEHLPPATETATTGQRPEPFQDLWAAVVEELYRSHRLVDRVYSLESDFDLWAQAGEPSPELVDLARERFRAATLFSARLLVTAWRRSATLAPDG